MWKRLLCTAILAHASFGVWAASRTAESYPTKPIRLIDGYPPGGTSDYLARLIGPKLTERYGQPVIVDNRPGAGSNIAAAEVARANPDGYTLMMGVVTGLASSPSLYPKLGYDLLKDFTFISRVATGANVLLAHPSIPVKSVSEVLALARSKPTAIRFGTAGVANPTHLYMELLQIRTGIKLLHVPYKGGPPAVAALAGGEVELGFFGVPVSMPHIKSKRLIPLAVTSGKRMESLPDVPTMEESGVAGFVVVSSFGIIAPAGTPPAVVKLLNAEVKSILQTDDVRTKFAALGLEAAGSTPEEFRAITEAEMARWSRVIKDARITIN